MIATPQGGYHYSYATFEIDQQKYDLLGALSKALEKNILISLRSVEAESLLHLNYRTPEDFSFDKAILVDGKYLVSCRPTEDALRLDMSELDSVKVSSRGLAYFKKNPDGLYPEFTISLPIRALPDQAPENALYDYYLDQYPTPIRHVNHWEVLLERPKREYDSMKCDDRIDDGLRWWGKGVDIGDMFMQYRFADQGLMCLDEAFIPMVIPRLGPIKQAVLIHLDDHTDLMSPRIAQTKDGYLDLITDQKVDFFESDSVKSAILSGAIGKGSIITMLLYAIETLHVRHLCARPKEFRHYGPNEKYYLDKTLTNDPFRKDVNTRLSTEFVDVETKELDLSRPTYICSDDLGLIFSEYPNDPVFLLHIDMDYFNNRFDGESKWEARVHIHNPDLGAQKHRVKEFCEKLKSSEIGGKIKDVTIGISPKFFPAEYWQPLTEYLVKQLHLAGVNVRGFLENKET